MNFQRKVFTVATAALFLAAAGLGQNTGTTSTGTSYTRTASFPVVGLASSETAQINIVNVAAASQSGTAASCTGSISFLSETGAVIGTATSFTVAGGQIFSVSLPFTKSGATTTRTSLRGQVTQTGTTGSGVPCALESSLETFDTNTGVTHLFVAGAQGGNGGGPGFGRP